MSFSKLILSVLAAVGLLAAQQGIAAAKTKVDGIAIVVNNSIVTLSEYRKKEREIRSRTPEASKEDIINSIIVESIIEQTAAENNINVSAQELDAAVKNFKESLNLDDEGLVKMLAEKDTTLKELFREIKLQILTTKLVQSEIARNNLYIDDKKVEEFYLKNNPDADPHSAEIRIAHILLPGNSGDSFDRAKEIADIAREEGNDFEDLAKLHSIDQRTAGRGGDLGYFKYDELIKPLFEAVDGTEPGEINGPVRSKAGIHIVKVLSIKEKGMLIPPEIKEALIDEMAAAENERIISSLIEKGFEKSYIDVRI